MFMIIKNSIQDFKASYPKYLSFALFYMLLTSFIFVPLISYIFNKMLKILGTGSLLNAEVYKIGLSPTGMLGMFFIGLIAVIILFIQFGVMIVIAQQRYYDKNILIAEAFVTALRKFPKLLGVGIFQLVLLFLVLTPFIDLSLFPALLDFNLPILLTSLVYDMSYFSILLYLFLVILAVSLLIRLLFTLHYIFIEEKSIGDAMKCSWRLAKSNRLTIVITLFMLNLLVFLLVFLIMTLISYIPSLTETMLIGDIIETYLVTFSGYLTIIFSLLFIPINIIIVTRLFFQFKQVQGEHVQDQLVVSSSKRLKQLKLIEKQMMHFFSRKRITLLSLIMIYVTGMFFIHYFVNDTIVYLRWNVQVAAHRGDMIHAPENSISSIQSAIEKGVDAVEIDVMMTKDGVIILNHDYDLNRVAGLPTRVEDMTFEQISQVDIGRLFSEEFVGENIPSLEMVLEELKEERVTLIIDVKINDPFTNHQFADTLVKLIEKHEMEQAVYVQSFDFHILQEIRSRNSEIKIGQILYLAAGNLSGLDVDFYTIRQTMLSDRFIKNARRQNREVWVWTVNIERNIREVLKYDIHGIITDYPEKVQQVIGIDFAQE